MIKRFFVYYYIGGGGVDFIHVLFIVQCPITVSQNEITLNGYVVTNHLE